MSIAQDSGEVKLLPHHKQLPLCTTRTPYRQGRRLTAVKVYTVNSESNHLLVFGVPSLSLRQETRALFCKFGKLSNLHVSGEHTAEPFTDTYHVVYDSVRCARLAKKMIDTKNFYGGSLHVCYAPELETLQETKAKLLQRKRDVLNRLRNLQKEAAEAPVEVSSATPETNMLINDGLNKESYKPIEFEYENPVTVSRDNVALDKTNTKVYMGDSNIIYYGKKRKAKTHDSKKRLKSSLDEKSHSSTTVENNVELSEVVDCTSTEKEVISNINEGLNYNKFGNETIKRIEAKPLNRIVFNVSKKT